MHPIEHLRYVARAWGVDAPSMVRETAHALASMGFDGAGLVVACRRVVERHPGIGPLWWLCARMLTAADPGEVAWELSAMIDDDPTASKLATAIPDDATVLTVGAPDLPAQALYRRGDVRVLAVDSRHSASAFLQRLERYDVACEPVQPEAMARAVGAADVVLLEALAVSPERVIAPIGSASAAFVALASGVPVWLAAGVGRRLPPPMLAAMIDRLATTDEPWELDDDVFLTGTLTKVAGPDGVVDATPEALAPECPMTSELLRSSPF